MFIFAFKREYFCPQRLVYEHDEQNPKSKIQKVIQRLATAATARVQFLAVFLYFRGRFNMADK